MCQLGERLPADVVETIGNNVPLKTAAQITGLSESTLRGWRQTMLLDERIAGLFSRVQGNVFFDLQAYAELLRDDQEHNRRQARKFRRGAIPLVVVFLLALSTFIAYAILKWTKF